MGRRDRPPRRKDMWGAVYGLKVPVELKTNHCLYGIEKQMLSAIFGKCSEGMSCYIIQREEVSVWQVACRIDCQSRVRCGCGHATFFATKKAASKDEGIQRKRDFFTTPK